jgi:hypothetical protein
VVAGSGGVVLVQSARAHRSSELARHIAQGSDEADGAIDPDVGHQGHGRSALVEADHREHDDLRAWQVRQHLRGKRLDVRGSARKRDGAVRGRALEALFAPERHEIAEPPWHHRVRQSVAGKVRDRADRQEQRVPRDGERLRGVRHVVVHDDGTRGLLEDVRPQVAVGVRDDDV